MFCSVKGMLLYVSVLSYADFNIMAFITSAAHSCCNVYVSMLMIRANTGEYIFKRNSSLVTLQLNLLSLSAL